MSFDRRGRGRRPVGRRDVPAHRYCGVDPSTTGFSRFATELRSIRGRRSTHDPAAVVTYAFDQINRPAGELGAGQVVGFAQTLLQRVELVLDAGRQLLPDED